MKSEKGKSLLKGCGKQCVLDERAAKEILDHIKGSQNPYLRTFLDNVGKSKEELAKAMDALPKSPAAKCSKTFSWCSKAAKCLGAAGAFLGHSSAQAKAEAWVEAGNSVTSGVILYTIEQISPVSPTEVSDGIREMKDQYNNCGDRVADRRFGSLLD